MVVSSASFQSSHSYISPCWVQKEKVNKFSRCGANSFRRFTMSTACVHIQKVKAETVLQIMKQTILTYKQDGMPTSDKQDQRKVSPKMIFLCLTNKAPSCLRAFLKTTACSKTAASVCHTSWTDQHWASTSGLTQRSSLSPPHHKRALAKSMC